MHLCYGDFIIEVYALIFTEQKLQPEATLWRIQGGRRVWWILPMKIKCLYSEFFITKSIKLAFFPPRRNPQVKIADPPHHFHCKSYYSTHALHI